MIIGMASGDVTKAKYILYEESYANLILYASAMPRYDDVKETTPKPTEIKTGGFASFLDSMAAIKDKYERR